ncbi:hypothetical protein ACWA06_04860 [Serratia rhizosphaerae]|nr:hypothetical protein I6G37_16190 [Serratia rubidaea]
MSYNQKVWSAVLLMCALFWAAIIGTFCTLNDHHHQPGSYAEQKNSVAKHPTC